MFIYIIVFLQSELNSKNIFYRSLYLQSHRIRKNKEPTAVSTHRVMPRAKLRGPDCLISPKVIFDPIKNSAITIPRLPNQLK